jgi:hypothetical protein
MAHYNVWRDGRMWHFEASSSQAGVRRGRRLTERGAIRAARRHAHHSVNCPSCHGQIYAESRKCFRCGAIIGLAPDTRRLTGA